MVPTPGTGSLFESPGVSMAAEGIRQVCIIMYMFHIPLWNVLSVNVKTPGVEGVAVSAKW